MISLFTGRKHFKKLTEREILALAISAEEDDSRIYADFAARLTKEFPATARIFTDMAAEEVEHRRRLIDRFQLRFDGPIPLIRREHVAGFYTRRPMWLLEELKPEDMRATAAQMERTAGNFYDAAAARTGDPETRKLLGDLAAAERGHERKATRLVDTHVSPEDAKTEEAAAHRQFVLTWVQPGLAGLMDGSVSTLAPIFATAFATQDPVTTLQVGLAASIGAGISMGFTEAASDDGQISGRGSPIKRGIAAGIMTTIGGLGHALPYLIPDFWTATSIALAVVFVELWAIAWIQNRYMDTPFARAAFQVVLGGALVLAAGILIGES
ncbi:MAG: rubrerythrin [Paracoccaceae bacterium]|jgi:rubrerythrin